MINRDCFTLTDSWHGAGQLKFGLSPNITIDLYVITEFSRNCLKFIVQNKIAGDVVSCRSIFDCYCSPHRRSKRNAIVCQSFRWLYAATNPITSQIARGPDDYDNFGEASQSPKAGLYTRLTGRRAIFNPEGRPNRDPVLLASTLGLADLPIFDDITRGQYWTARDMVKYLLSLPNNSIYNLLPIRNPGALTGLSHSDWNKVIHNVSVEGLNAVEALSLVCNSIGWTFREDYYNESQKVEDIADDDDETTRDHPNTGDVFFAFYKPTTATGHVRSDSNRIIFHNLYAPPAGENIKYPIAEGRKMLWSMSLSEDISRVINRPLGITAPDKFEITAELVPAWQDSELVPDTSEDYSQLCFSEADLQGMNEQEKNSYTFFSHYHVRGSNFVRNVGRKWALNEAGKYTGSAGGYDRGKPFDFSTVIPANFIISQIEGREGTRLYAPFSRQFLPCLTLDKDTLNSVGIRVEFSFDGGVTWQIIPAAITNLRDECGIYITEPNLAEIVDINEGDIELPNGETPPIYQLNYWTSLCNDKLSEHAFKDGQWQTRIRVTAAIVMDLRGFAFRNPTAASGSPFHQSQIYDFSAKTGVKVRTESSLYNQLGQLPADESNIDAAEESEWFDRHLGPARDTNEGMSVSGQFTLERLWLGDGSGQPDFMVGDCIAKIAGRDYNLSTGYAGGAVYPEIIQIIYLPDRQKMRLITRDMRFAEVVNL